MKEKNKKLKQINTSVILLIYLIIVILAKIIRHTILKATLVDMSVGYSMLRAINENLAHFTVVFSLSTGEAACISNSNAIFQLFKFLGLSTTIDYEILITFLWNLMFIAIILKLKNKLSIFEFIFLCMSVAVLNIWDFCLAKEPIQMLYFVLIFCILTSKRIKEKSKFFMSLLIIALSIITFRNYYILFLGFSIVAYFIFHIFIINKKKVSYKDLLKIIILFGLTYFVMLSISKAILPEIYSQFTYFNSRVTKAKTDLSGIFRSSNQLIATIDYLLLLIRMLFPVELFRFGLSYSIYALYQIFLSILFLKSFKNLKRNSYVQNIALFLFVGFLFASATFEPDFGSWVRHEAVALPLILVAIGFYNDKSKTIKE